MAAGGWNLVQTWLSDAVGAKNWPLILELLSLLNMCPVTIERLKSNSCPKVIKTLTKESECESEYFIFELGTNFVTIIRSSSMIYKCSV